MQNNTFNEYFARGQFYDMVDGKKTLCEVKEVGVTLIAATANQTVVAAVTGKSIVVLEGNIYSVGAANAAVFLNGSGGAILKAYQVPINTAATPNVQLPKVEWGLMRTTAGTGLFANTGAGGNLVVTLTYIEVSR